MRSIYKLSVVALSIFCLTSAFAQAKQDSESGQDIVESKEADQRFSELEKFVKEFKWVESVKLMNGHVSDLRSEDLEPRISGFMTGKEGSASLTCVENGKIVVSQDSSKLDMAVDSTIQAQRTKALSKNKNRRAKITRAETTVDPDTSKSQSIQVEDHLIGKGKLLEKSAQKADMYCVITTMKN
jgi:hypothetical protein